MFGASALNALLGAWLVISPAVLDYGDDDAVWNPIVAGALVLVLGGLRAARVTRGSWPGWANFGIGMWLFASGFWLADSGDASWNAFLSGAIVVFLAIVSLAGSVNRPVTRRGG